MSGFKNVMKDGWHPKGKDGKSKESWRGDFKGLNQVVSVNQHPAAAHCPAVGADDVRQSG